MARQNRKYLVSYKIKWHPPCSEEVMAEDAACALGLVLDALEDDGIEPQFEWVMIRSAAAKITKKTTKRQATQPVDSAAGPVTFTRLPAGVMEAYQQALAEEKKQ